jgi:hypothetical protein
MAPRDAVFALVISVCGVAVLIIWPGEDRQAHILSFDGVPLGAFVGSRAQPGHFRLPLAPGMHEIRVVIPGPCTYYDGHPGRGRSRSNMRFTSKAGAQYEVRLDSRPNRYSPRPLYTSTKS